MKTTKKALKDEKVEKNLQEQLNNRNELVELEQNFIDFKIEKMNDSIEKEKERLTNEIIEYANTHTEPIRWSKSGDPVEYGVKINPVVINNYFFKSVVPIGSIEPQYNPEKLALIYNYYCDILAEVNANIGNFPPSLSSFCKLAGITLSTLRQLKNSNDLNMRIIVEKIYDEIGDNNITMGQLGVVKDRMTLFRLKSQNELLEKVQPSVHINIVEQPDMKQINERINKYKFYADKKEK